MRTQVKILLLKNFTIFFAVLLTFLEIFIAKLLFLQ